ncbi:uncharacterized protein [Prorops nasuta]|uniref:uncharacterized protein n=1 Tax=Prorops nasuta TaxID=863751 RepID=UPI0034CE1369
MVNNTKRLINQQRSREAEISNTLNRIRAKDQGTLTRENVQLRINDVKAAWDEIRQLNAEIIGFDDVDAVQYQNDKVLERLQQLFEDSRDELLSIKNNISEILSGPMTSSQLVGNDDGSIDHRTEKLPKLDLPSFYGKYEDWESFSDLFISLVHNRTNLSDSTKLQYLKMCLKEGAADFVKGISITDANYASTWRALKVRYCNPRLIVRNYLMELASLGSVKRESAEGLRELLDNAQRIIRGLESLGLPIAHWDIWLVHMVSSLMDPDSQKLWESEISIKDRGIVTQALECNKEPVILERFPTFQEFIDFLERRVQSLGMIVSVDSMKDLEVKLTSVNNHRMNTRMKKVVHVSHSTNVNSSTDRKCYICSGAHMVFQCTKFIKKAVKDRRIMVKRNRLCFNCLGKHTFALCPSERRCNICKEKHHTLIHLEKNTKNISTKDLNTGTSFEPARSINTVKTLMLNKDNYENTVILATAQVILMGPNDTKCIFRALLDQGAECSFVSENVVQTLNLKKWKVNISLSGVGVSRAVVAKARVNLTLKSTCHFGFELEFEALVLPRLTAQLPSREIILHKDQLLIGKILADHQFYRSGPIDLILGADIYGQLLLDGIHKLSLSGLVAQNTRLGWIISGPVVNKRLVRTIRNTGDMQSVHMHNCLIDENISKALQRFWELEEVLDQKKLLSPADEYCENMFKQTYKRLEDGRFMVRLPLKSVLPRLASETRNMALRTLSQVHRRFLRDNRLAKTYREFMESYESLGHMEKIKDDTVENDNAWYLPHHAVVQINPWKLRVVFDASRKTCNQSCLNDYLYNGPSLQNELSLILINWRKYRYAFTADVVKMFRQVLVHPADRDCQRILWAPGPNDAVIEYRLNTVTYGTGCAPYLAIRVLLELARSSSNLPLGSKCLTHNTYVDDIFSGSDILERALVKRNELIKLLQSAGMELDKWSANHMSLMPTLSKESIKRAKGIDKCSSIKTLGVQWMPVEDTFGFKVKLFEYNLQTITKRIVLSDIAKLFDPLGLLSPIIVVAKIIMQDIWLNKCEWDSPLPSELYKRWITYRDSLSDIAFIKIDRWLGFSPKFKCEIHGFSDASVRAYAAAVYLRICLEDGNYRVFLLMAKSKVSPVKTVSVPKLELSGAALLVKIVCYLQHLEFLRNLPVFLWSDSQIVLSWLCKHPSTWKTFVANRVSQIQTELPAAVWRYVCTSDNPADLATRGNSPGELRVSDLWWHGPYWLSLKELDWPLQPQKRLVLIAQNNCMEENELLNRFSSLTRLTRVIAYCLRPLLKLRSKKLGIALLSPFLSTEELKTARLCIIRLSQATYFESEIELLSNKRPLPKKSPLLKLNPFFDEQDRIIRVGGRLIHSSLNHEAKHPPILSKKSNLSILFIRCAHQTSLHGGAVNLVKREIRLCMKCQRIRPRFPTQLMGNLPSCRVTPARPFSISGLDYAGPFQIKFNKGRGVRTSKGYVALFVCFTTKAIHLELVGDLTTASFLAAFRRFIGRRGHCQQIYSDNGSTFQGAARELRKMFHTASDFYKDSAAILANDQTSWNFIPPNTPHCGGLWEAGIKSTKHHMKRVIGEQLLTYEEFSTLLVEIEACLNSRPLCPMSKEVDDLSALTPSHFLIGTQAGVLLEEDSSQMASNQLDRFQLIQRIRNSFWKRWSTEYLHHLQTRSKWRSREENFAIGQLVTMRDDRYPPSKWLLGRIIEVHPASDNIVRVVTVKTANSRFRRHISRLCPLYINVKETALSSNPT